MSETGKLQPVVERRLVRCVDCCYGKINNGAEVRCSSPKTLPVEVIQKTSDSGWTLASAAAICPNFHPANADVHGPRP
jgi:hypothetical protein